MKRRDFLKNSASLMALGSLSQLAPSLSWALTTQDQFLLTVFLDGGADVSLGLDPWTKEQRPDSNDYFIEYTSNDLIKVGDVVYGPALSGMTNVLSDFSVVRGIFLSENDNGHPPAEAMMRSGNGSNKYPDLAIEFASMHDDDDSFGVATSQLLNQLDRTVSQIDIHGLEAMTPITDSNKGFQGSGAVNRARMELLRKSAQINKFVSLRNQIKGDDEKKTLAASIAA
ncbi:MAG: hypothetical protein J7501_17425, partial [Bdellovibrio sp.]|nr:hypothetical protein [Bdellovibrio sp.]